MSSVKELSPAQCILLAVHLASESNIPALHSFTPTRLDALDPELVLRIILTYLPESVSPAEYISYVGEVASRLYLDVDREDVVVDTSPVKDLTPEQAERKVKKLRLREIQPQDFPSSAPKDLLTRFLCHRALRIDSETGLLQMVPALIEPFLNRNDYIRTWYISVVLPLLRLEVEYYPEDESLAMPLSEFEQLEGPKGVNFLVQKASEPSDGEKDSPSGENIGRDIKSLVGPWMYGSTERKRRKLYHGKDHSTDSPSDSLEEATNGIAKIGLDGIQESDKATGHDWEYIFHWLVDKSQSDFPLVARAIEDWDGPGDVDLGGFDRGGIAYLDEEIQRKLELQYAQAIFASCYAAQKNDEETVRCAHDILARLAELLEFIPPPDLATSVEALPQIERHATKLEDSRSLEDIAPKALLRAEHPLTTPRQATYMLLQMMVYSAYQFAGLGHPLSLVNVTKLHFYATADEQSDVLKAILKGLTKSGARKDDSQWTADRAKLVWLWNWGIADSEHEPDGAGVLGKIPKELFEEEMLKAFTETSCYQLAINIYIADKSPEERARAEKIVIGKAMEAYDGASNGNRNRGGMKKAGDIIAAYRPEFPNSIAFQQAAALIAATHSLSFYSLTLQQGIPFQPASIRSSTDPLSLISKLLEQNPRSYTKLDDLIDIARNFVAAGLVHDEDADNSAAEMDSEELVTRKKDAERRVKFMAIEASLREDDFETAYSYIVNRLTPSGPSDPSSQAISHTKRTSLGSKTATEDDISWRAAFLAGRYRPNTTTPPTLRRLEQRTELLSLALLLAPKKALTEILAVWRRCEEETTTLQRAQAEAEREFDDRADKRLSGGGGMGSSALPGNFTMEGQQPELVLGQKRREMGRGMGAGDGEVPLSMFDLTRSAARAFSKTTSGFTGQERIVAEGEQMGDSVGSLAEGERVRKRDMVANAVSGGLASGLGWVLGATPVQQQQGSEH